MVGSATLRNGTIAACGFLVALASCSSSAPESVEEVVVDPAAFCQKLTVVAGPSAPLARLDLTDPDSVDAAMNDLRSLEATAPPLITADVVVVIAALDDLLTALELPDNRTAAEVVLERTEALTTAGLSAQALENFAAQTCLLDLDPIVRPTPTPVNTDDVAPA